MQKKGEITQKITKKLPPSPPPYTRSVFLSAQAESDVKILRVAIRMLSILSPNPLIRSCSEKSKGTERYLTCFTGL